jgi:hypothetical protein
MTETCPNGGHCLPTVHEVIKAGQVQNESSRHNCGLRRGGLTSKEIVQKFLIHFCRQRASPEGAIALLTAWMIAGWSFPPTELLKLRLEMTLPTKALQVFQQNSDHQRSGKLRPGKANLEGCIHCSKICLGRCCHGSPLVKIFRDPERSVRADGSGGSSFASYRPVQALPASFRGSNRSDGYVARPTGPSRDTRLWSPRSPVPCVWKELFRYQRLKEIANRKFRLALPRRPDLEEERPRVRELKEEEERDLTSA